MSVPCGNFECNFKLTTDPRTGDPGAAYEIVDPLNPAQPLQRIDYPLTAGKMLGGEIIVVSQENVDNVNKLADLIESGNFNQLSELEFDENDPQYSALRKKILLETGINLDEISDPKYVSEINEIVTTAKRSRDNFRSLGIEVDANGNPLTLKDQQRMREILSKNGGAEFDLLTRAQLDLARTRIKEVAAQLSACQGDVYCSVKMDDLKKLK